MTITDTLLGLPAGYSRNRNFRPSPDDVASGTVQVCGQSSPVGYSIWRRQDEPGLWRRWGSGEEVPYKEWRLLVPDAELELAQRRRLDDLARVQGLIAEATRGPAQAGEAQAGYFVRELPGGMGVVCHADGAEMSPPLAVSIAKSIHAELVGAAEQEEADE